MSAEPLPLSPNEVSVLRAFLPLGLATTPQLTQVTGLSREIVNAALNRLIKEQDDRQRTFIRLAPATRIYAGSKGRPPALYWLGPLGAQWLRDNDSQPSAKACQIKGALALSHAICIRDVYFLAHQAGRELQVEHVIHFGEDQSIRADVLLASPNGQQTIFEVEQAATPATLERLLEKIRRLTAFFRSPQCGNVTSDVRVLFNVGHTLEGTTRRIWEKTLAAIAQEHGGDLPCRFWAMPLTAFLERPEWESLETFTNLFNPAKLATFGPLLLKQPEEEVAEEINSILPAELRPVRVVDSLPDLTILRAYLAVFHDELEAQSGTANGFFDLIRWIYFASHSDGSPTVERAALPLASLFLLRQYLESVRHSDLRTALIKATQDVRSSYYRGNHIVRDRMTSLIWDVFLRYHGFGRGGPLQAFVALPDFDRGRSEFHVRVTITNPDLVIGADELLIPGEAASGAEALAWVLEALLLYSNELGLGKPKTSTEDA